MLNKFVFLLLVAFLSLTLQSEQLNLDLEPEVICILPVLDTQKLGLQNLDEWDEIIKENQQESGLPLSEKLKLFAKFKYLESKVMAKDQWNLTREQWELIKKYWQQYLALGLTICIASGTIYFLCKN